MTNSKSALQKMSTLAAPIGASLARALTLSIVAGATFLSTAASAADVSPITLQYTSDVPANQKDLIELDMSRITSPEFSLKTPNVTKLFGLSGLSGLSGQSGSVTPQALQSWLQARMHIILPTTYQYAFSKMDYYRTSYKFPFPKLFPSDNRDAQILNQIQIVKSTVTPESAVGVSGVPVMENVGAVAYSDSKKADRGMLSVSLPGIGRVPIASPRVGMIKLGEGLFPEAYSQSELEKLPNSLVRISQYFHEARHSDGNGLTQGFFHVVCPAGSAYAGIPACDSSRNGAYTVQAEVLKAYAESCKSCGPGIREKLRTIYIDAFARVLKQMPIAKTHSPEELAQLVSQCNLFKTNGWNPPASCPIYLAEYESAKAKRPPTRITIEWDDAPELATDGTPGS